MKKLSFILFCCIGFVSQLAAQTSSTATPTLSIGSAVNLSGKQRMLSQRMAKTFVYMGMNINAEAANKERTASMILFEENLKALMGYAPTEKIKNLLAREEALWKDYKKQIFAEINQENAKAILASNTTILTACDDVVKAYVEYSATLPKREEEQKASFLQIAENANISGRQRMLTQRLTFYYAAYVWGITEPGTEVKLKGYADLIRQSYSKLITSEINTSDIDDELAATIGDWREVEERCTKDNCFTFDNKGMDVTQMYAVCATILKHMDKVTGMYAKLSEQ